MRDEENRLEAFRRPFESHDDARILVAGWADDPNSLGAKSGGEKAARDRVSCRRCAAFLPGGIYLDQLLKDLARFTLVRCKRRLSPGRASESTEEDECDE